jgi:hypothetical protein
MSSEQPLKLIGYWNERTGDGFIDPVRLAGRPLDVELKPSVLDYLRGGQFCGEDLGFSWCRFRCGIPDQAMGSAELSDGIWAWPEGLVHYVAVHDVELPKEFLTHLISHRFTIDPDLRWEELISRDRTVDYWKEWCVSS